MKIKPLPPAMFFHYWLRYDAKTGIFTWKQSPHARIPIGTVAGSVKSGGYVHIVILRRGYKAHRIAWLMHHDCDPIIEMDHRDGNRANNMISNLRLATMAQNHQNRRKSKYNTSGHTGVYFDRGIGRWCARIRALPQRIFLGTFDTAEAAGAAYLAAKAKLHTFHPDEVKR